MFLANNQTIKKNVQLKSDKFYGQNFLVDKNILQKIVEAGELSANDCVVEVGTGQGVLTEALLKQAGQVISFEIDKRFLENLQEKFLGQNKLTIYNLDFLQFNLQDLPCLNYKVVANIPYNITSKILEKFLTSLNKPSLIVVLVQKEMAQKICAVQGEKSFFSVLVQYFGQPEILHIVKPQSFIPPPQVDSAILKISQISQRLPAQEEKFFFKIVKTGFSQKRKMLKKNLKAIFTTDKIETAFVTCKLPKTIRAEDLEVKDWLKLTAHLS